ncbi:hypothetical protein FB45DRAFT_1059613 [Roridomyces roridus]|uniref:Uncharacterized protein n=1 Tax=Roridomyces roridus TaxID=1738132 RepID=A0AAD7BS06_9AGAR|nr:hypothetical protein FB45DRAFT_1059613 [Roridomyces roridus]
MTSTTNNTNTSGIGNKIKGGVKVAHGMIKGKTVDSAVANAQSTEAGDGMDPDGAGREHEQNSTNNSNAYAAGNYGWGLGLAGINPFSKDNQTSTANPGVPPPTNPGRGPSA